MNAEAYTHPLDVRERLEAMTTDELYSLQQSLDESALIALQKDWYLRKPGRETKGARLNQIPPRGKWEAWLVLAGRGFGKTRTGAEWVHERVREGARSIACIGPTAGDVRDYMVYGPSGLLASAREGETPVYEPSKRLLTWPNGAQAHLYTSEEPKHLRGPQHDTAWCDELCAWENQQEVWDMMQFGLRMGEPRVIVTTTPRPQKLLRELMTAESTVISSGSTFDNEENLAPEFIRAMRKKYAGTALGEQELYAKILSDVKGALWKKEHIKHCTKENLPYIEKTVVAIDPSVAESGDGDECGILVMGLDGEGQVYILSDMSGNYSPNEWAAVANDLCLEYSVDCVVAERNNGGALVESVLRAFGVSTKVNLVWAAKSKKARAEPLVLLYEQGKVYHFGVMQKLEDEMVTWSAKAGEASPNRIDALVWGAFELCGFGDKRADMGEEDSY